MESSTSSSDYYTAEEVIGSLIWPHTNIRISYSYIVTTTNLMNLLLLMLGISTIRCQLPWFYQRTYTEYANNRKCLDLSSVPSPIEGPILFIQFFVCVVFSHFLWRKVVFRWTLSIVLPDVPSILPLMHFLPKRCRFICDKASRIELHFE